jgi:hypothetical protein
MDMSTEANMDAERTSHCKVKSPCAISSTAR